MKKVLIIIIVILLLAMAGMGGYLWYQNTHIFVEDAAYSKNADTLDLRGQDISFAHYDTVRAQLPNCLVFWDVPFQGQKISNDSKTLTITQLTQEDIEIMSCYFPLLQQVDATGCDDYAILETLQEALPKVDVTYQVSLGATSAEPGADKLSLENGSFTYETLMENLQYLHKVTELHFVKAQLEPEQVAALAEAYPEITVTYTTEILGKEYAGDTTTLDLSAMTPGDVADVAGKLHMLTALESVELMTSEGTSQLSLTDVKTLMESAPGVSFHYTFEFCGTQMSTDAEEIILKGFKLKDYTDFPDQLREVLDVLVNCKRFVLDNNGQYHSLWQSVDDEVFAQIREEYAGRTKFVWRVFFGDNGSSLTDAQILRVVYGLVDDNSSDLQYLNEVRYMDLGHSDQLDYCEFVRGMTSLEAVIVSGAPLRNIEPFADCPNLKFFEMANCGYITDISPLSSCTQLEMLNISYSGVTDLSPLDEITTLTHLEMKVTKVPAEERDRFIALHPDCWTTYEGTTPYATGWRTNEDGTLTEWYSALNDVFKYLTGPTPNNIGWYFEDET